MEYRNFCGVEEYCYTKSIPAEQVRKIISDCCGQQLAKQLAIKQLRDETKMTLKDSKEIVEHSIGLNQELLNFQPSLENIRKLFSNSNAFEAYVVNLMSKMRDKD